MRDSTSLLIQALLASLPLLIVYGVGIGLGLAYRRRAPQASTLAIAACTMHLVTSLASNAAHGWMGMQMSGEGWTMEQLGVAMGVLRIATTLGHTVATALLLAAVFTGRSKAG